MSIFLHHMNPNPATKGKFRMRKYLLTKKKCVPHSQWRFFWIFLLRGTKAKLVTSLDFILIISLKFHLTRGCTSALIGIALNVFCYLVSEDLIVFYLSNADSKLMLLQIPTFLCNKGFSWLDFILVSERDDHAKATVINQVHWKENHVILENGKIMKNLCCESTYLVRH